MTRTFSDGHPKALPACNFLSQYYFYNIFLQNSCRFSLQTLTKFEAAKTGKWRWIFAFDRCVRRVENVGLAILTFCTKREYIPSNASLK